MKIPLTTSDRRRAVAREADVLLKNRFLERNPVLSDDMPAAIARPGLEYWTAVDDPGNGPIRAIFHQPGAFNDDVFVVTHSKLQRVDRLTGAATTVFGAMYGGGENLTVRMACTGDIGTIGPRLWIADGRSLLVYMEDGFATGVFTATAVADADVVRIDNTYYRFTTPGFLDVGAPDGTAGNPWRVALEASVVGNYTNLYHAINATGIPGTTYTTALTAHTTVTAMQAVTNGLFVRALAEGDDGNGIVTTETGANMEWASGVTVGGGEPGVIFVPTPEEVGVLDLGVINSFVVVIPAQGEGINGRFYWVEPGETSIDPLNFATAERSADPIYQVVVFGDQFWLAGQSTTEVWFMSGDPEAPVQRLQGVLFDRGIHSGTAIQVRDSMVLLDSSGAVIQFRGNEKRISTPDIEERLRKAINYQNIISGG